MSLVFQFSPSTVCCTYVASGILFTKQIFVWHFFQREIEYFIECVVECVNAGIDDQKYILITVLRENIQKGIFQQITNIYLFQNIFFLFFKVFKLNFYVSVYYNENLLQSANNATVKVKKKKHIKLNPRLPSIVMSRILKAATNRIDENVYIGGNIFSQTENRRKNQLQDD